MNNRGSNPRRQPGTRGIMAGAGYGDRLVRGAKKASFTTGAGVSQERWDAAFAPAAEPEQKESAGQVAPTEKSEREIANELISGIEDEDIRGSEILECLLESCKDWHRQDLTKAMGTLEDRKK